MIRNKKYIDRVIYLDATNSGADAKLYLNAYHGRLMQRWEYTDKYLVSRYHNLSIHVVGDSMANGAAICAQASKTNKWSLTPGHDFFTITSRQDTKVLEAGPRETLKGRNVLVSFYNGGDSQLWLWDDKNIRSKKIPDTVLELNPIDHEIDGIYWVKVFLNRFNDDKTRRWKFNRGKLFSAYIGLALDINITNTAGGAEVGCTLNKKGLNQEWSLNSKERIMFAIKGVQSGKALNVASDLGIVIWTCSGTDN